MPLPAFQVRGAEQAGSPNLALPQRTAALHPAPAGAVEAGPRPCVCVRNFCGKAQEARGGTPWGTGGPWWTWYLWEGDFPLGIFFVVLMNYESALAI